VGRGVEGRGVSEANEATMNPYDPKTYWISTPTGIGRYVRVDDVLLLEVALDGNPPTSFEVAP
jgi:hypothetical protein